ncbi:MAG: dehalogenase [Chloroflexi bacterium]|nr:MAG: dehalogenase [Chloroflexota bacterium]MBL1194878.1 dehalogenase [Chloroflexota bacterium]NOH12169.1 dehalogenase [Chloroflexota bacterium]
MLNLIIGALASAAFFLLLNYVKEKEMTISWWQWLLTILGILFAILTLEVIFGFIAEGAGQAALVMGMIFGIITVIWAVLLGRFVFARS